MITRRFTKYTIPIFQDKMDLASPMPTTLYIEIGRDEDTKEPVVYGTGERTDLPANSGGFVVIDTKDLSKAELHLFDQRDEESVFPLTIKGEHIPRRIEITAN